MQQRLAAIFALLAFGILVLWAVNWRAAPSADNRARVTFQIATGPSGATDEKP